MRKKRNWLIVLGIILLGIQFIRIDKKNPPVDASVDYISITQPPEDVVRLLRTACYDCHSHETRYPWYSNIAPVSWWLKNHIDHGRKHFNFSIMGTLEPGKFAHKMEEAAEEVKKGAMPLKSYTWTHGGARLTDEERSRLVQWFMDSTPDEDAMENVAE